MDGEASPGFGPFWPCHGEVEKELLVNRPSKATAENVMEEATTKAEVMEEPTTITLADPTPNEQ